MDYGRTLSGDKLVALFQKFCERGLRVAFDDKAFLFRPPFTFTRCFPFPRHFVLLSQMFSAGEKLVPRLGVGPRWLIKPRECKSRLSTSSSTGASSVKDVGAVMPLKESPAPTFFRPSSATLNPSSQRTSYAKNQVSGKRPRFNHSSMRQAVPLSAMFPKSNDVSFPRHAVKHAVNSIERIPASGSQSLDYFSASDTIILAKDFLAVQDDQDSIRDVDRSCGKGNGASVYSRYLREAIIDSERSAGCNVDNLLRVIWFFLRQFWRWRCGWLLRRKSDCCNHFLESLKLFTHGFGRARRLKLMWTELHLQMVRVFHNTLLQLIFTHSREAQIQCQS